MPLSSEQQQALREPFDPENEIEWRVQRVNKNNSAVLVAYVTARAIMDRLDSVFGVDGWSVTYQTVVLGKHEGFLCTIEVPGCTKQDISDLSDIEALKGGVSGALKRCAVLFGIGRYLYDLGEEYAEIKDGRGPKGSISCKKQDGTYGYVLRPKLPEWARPKAKQPPTPEQPAEKPVGGVLEAARTNPDHAKEAPPGAAGQVVPERDHHESWTNGGNRKFMARYSETFPSDEGYDYGMLADWLESINKKRPSQMTDIEREKLLGYIAKGDGRKKFVTFVQQILEDREKSQ